MNAGGVGRARHRAAERIDLARQVALADAADRRVAAHLAQRFDVVRQEQRARAHARGREGGLGAGVTAADDDDLEVFGMEHGNDAPGYLPAVNSMNSGSLRRGSRSGSFFIQPKFSVPPAIAWRSVSMAFRISPS
jgi:hypothetical protein